MKAILRAQDGKTVYQIRNAVTTVGRDGSDINLQVSCQFLYRLKKKADYRIGVIKLQNMCGLLVWSVIFSKDH